MFNRLFENFEYNFFIKRKKLKYDTKDGQYVKQNISKRNKDYYNIIFLLSLYTIQGIRKIVHLRRYNIRNITFFLNKQK